MQKVDADRGVCAIISTGHRGDGGSIPGYFGGWRDRADCGRRPHAVSRLSADHDPDAEHKSSGHVLVLVCCCRVWLDGQLADGPRHDDELREREFIRAAGTWRVQSAEITHTWYERGVDLIIDTA